MLDRLIAMKTLLYRLENNAEYRYENCIAPIVEQLRRDIAKIEELLCGAILLEDIADAL